ncbi:CHAD domain-containing protein [Chitinophaga sp. Mgbs1]|uniref:CHAD domain-containing protein n=1 Tax=Chitinophaga solisilvae TaxID=1233460 RepID=A0A3S1CY27_9BACT|nr:CHAD domain-containing protein [Chitinophaga solisilvae]
MLKATLYKYLQQECDTVADAFGQLGTAAKRQHAIHTIRVSGKKIRALLALAAQLPDYRLKTGRYLTSLKLLQSVSGISRDTRLQELALSKHEKQLAWRFGIAHLLLKNKQLLADDQLMTTIKRISLKKLLQLPEHFEAALAAVDEVTGTAVLQHHILAQYHDTRLPSVNARHTAWHDLRKRMKALYYQLSIMKMLLPDASAEKDLLKRCKAAGEQLGSWHDASELLLFVKDVIVQAKKEQLRLPVKSGQLLKLLQQDAKEKLLAVSI